jgi:hypothetical protein
VDVDVVVRDREAAQLVSRLARRLDDGRPALVGLVDRILFFQRERFEGAAPGGASCRRRRAARTFGSTATRGRSS